MDMAKARIQVVENEGIIAQDFVGRLNQMGYEASSVQGSAETVWQEAIQFAPDLVLMEMVLKGELDGIEAAKQLRHQIDIPVVFIAAHADPQILERIKACDPAGFLFKPVRDLELRVAIEIALHRHARRKQNEDILRASKDGLEQRVLQRTRALRTQLLKSRRAEAALLESEGKYRSLFETISEGFAVHEVLWDEGGGPCDYRFLEVNPAFERITGLKKEALVGKTLLDLFPAREQRWVQLYGEVVLSGEPVRCEEYFPGLDKHFDILAFQPGEKRLATVLIDITERRKVEQRRLVQNSFTLVLAESATIGEAAPQILQTICQGLGWKAGILWLIDSSAEALLCRDSWQGEVESTRLEEERIPVTLARGESLPGKVWASGKPVWSPDILADSDHWLRRDPLAQGELRAAFGAPILRAGRVIGVMEFFGQRPLRPDPPLLDLMATLGSQLGQFLEHKQAEAALRESEKRYRELVDFLPDAILVHDGSSWLFANDAAARLVGAADPRDFIGLPIWDFFPSGMYAAIQRRARRAIEGERSALLAHKILRMDGETVDVESADNPITFEGQAAVLMVIRDTRDRKRLEEQLLQSQKMEAVGSLAGGVAHDFNNLLTIILGYTSTLILRFSPEHRFRKDLEQIYLAGERAASLTRQLLAFSRKQVLQPQILDLNAVVADLEKMLRRMIGEDIEMVTVLAPELGHVEADPGQLQQVIMNLAVNSRDAMPQGGRLVLETADVDLGGEPSRVPSEIVPGRYVMLSISDSGCGMDRETQSHVFEPFFTTKSLGRGTGLGLSTVYGIVKQSGGYIYLESEPGQGTTFRIYLPQVHGKAADWEGHADSTEERGGTETVLLVEDDSAVLEMTAHVLREQGYTVLASGGGKEALRLSRQHPGPIHLLLTDVVMPGISGRNLVSQIGFLRPATRVLYMSGYTDKTILHHGVLDPEMALLQKPFAQKDLTRKVRQILDRVPVSRSALILEEENRVRALLRRTLEQAGFEVLEVHAGQQSLEDLRVTRVDLVIAGRMRPKEHGSDFIRILQASHPESRAILLSEHPDDSLLNVGDCARIDAILHKPIHSGELLAAIQGIFGNSQDSPETRPPLAGFQPC
jgi:PAS domain S-box-containing protein